MRFVLRDIYALAHNPGELLSLCRSEKVVALTDDNDARLVVLDVDYYNRLIEDADAAELYKDFWQTEGDGHPKKSP